MRFSIIHIALLVFLLSHQSLAAAGKTRKADEEKWKITWEKLSARSSVKPDSSIKAANAWLAEVKDHKSWASKAYCIIGKAQYYAGNNPACETAMKTCLDLQEGTGDAEVKGQAWYYLAMVPYGQKLYDESIPLFEKAIPHLSTSGNKWVEANAHFLLGFSYTKRQDISGAREHYKKAIELFKFFVDSDVMGDTYAFWGDLEYYDAKDYTQAAEQYAAAAKVYDGAGDGKNGAYYHAFAGDVYRYLKKSQTALDEYFTAVDYYDSVKDEEKIAKYTKIIGELYAEAGNIEEAAKFFLESAGLRQKQGNYTDEGDCYISLGNMYYFAGNYPNGLMYYRKSLDCYEKAKNPGGQAGSYVGLGNFYQGRGEFDKALEMYNKSIALYEQEEVKNWGGMSSVYTGMGNCYFSRFDYDKALEYYLLSLESESKAGENVADLSVSYINIANIYINKKDYPSAQKYLDLAIKESERTGNQHRQGAALKLRGFYYINNKMPGKAFEDCSKALDITEALGLKPEVMECYKCLYFAAKDQDNYVDALTYYSYYISTRDSINNEKRNNEINKREIQYEYEKKETQLRMAEEKKQLALQEEIKRKQLLFQFESRQARMKAEAEKKELSMGEELKRKQLAMEYEKQQAISKIERDKKELELNRDIEKKDIQNREQKRLTNWLMAGLALFCILTFIILKGYRDKKKANKTILAQKEETEKQKGIIELKSMQLEEKNREIVDSITYARRLQEAILPPQKLVKQYLNDSFILYKPRDIVAGDFYWMETVPSSVSAGNVILFAVADCTGHGVPGAMVSVVCSGAMNRAVKEFGLTSPGPILDKVRDLVIETFEKSESEVKDGMDISLCALDLNTYQLTWAGANNPLWILRNDTQTIEEVKADKQPIGVTDHPKPFTTHQLQLHKDDVVYLSSDGYADQFGGEKGKKLKDANLKKLLLEIYREPMEQQSKQLNEAFEAWRGGLEQVDDVCVIGVRV